MSQQDIKNEIRAFLRENIAGNENIADDAPLISSRMMDSIIALKLVSHLEEKFGIEFEAHEVDQDNLDSINAIAAFVQTKMK
jgi:acyl carrier protein